MPTSPTTPAAIVYRMIAVIEALSPTSLGTAFRAYRDENPDFIEHCETKPAGALRRFQVKDAEVTNAETSSGVEEEHVATFVVTIAYPRTGRYGEDQARDRKRVMREDQSKIEKAIGMLGKANFTPPTYPDATWLADGSGSDVQEGEACDYLVLTLRMLYVLDVS